MLTKKNFIAAAKVVKEIVDGGEIGTAERVFDVLAEIFLDSNPKFDTDRFKTACGLAGRGK